VLGATVSDFLGKLAYEAYLEACGGRSLVTDAPLPPWEDQDPAIQRAWTHVADRVLDWRRELP
jgi:hypothetical protein